MTCYGCGSDAHLLSSKKCSPGAIAQHARRRLNGGTRAVHLLSELISGMEGDLFDTSSDQPNDPSEAEELEILLAHVPTKRRNLRLTKLSSSTTSEHTFRQPTCRNLPITTKRISYPGGKRR
eukprot:IDg21798t1